VVEAQAEQNRRVGRKEDQDDPVAAAPHLVQNRVVARHVFDKFFALPASAGLVACWWVIDLDVTHGVCEMFDCGR